MKMIKQANIFRFAGILLCLIGTMVQAETWSTLTGQFVAEGKLPEKPAVLISKEYAVCGTDILDDSLVIDQKTRGISNIFIYLNHAPDRIHPDAKSKWKRTVPITSNNCQFVPRALIARTSQPICFTTDEGLLHHIRAVSFSNPSISQTVADQSEVTLNFANADRFPIKVTCDSHYWMQSWWLILDHPYAAVTDQNGRFEIPDLPLGEHTFTVWHERSGYVLRDWKVIVDSITPTKLDTVKIPIEKFEI